MRFAQSGGIRLAIHRWWRSNMVGDSLMGNAMGASMANGIAQRVHMLQGWRTLPACILPRPAEVLPPPSVPSSHGKATPGWRARGGFRKTNIRAARAVFSGRWPPMNGRRQTMRKPECWHPSPAGNSRKVNPRIPTSFIFALRPLRGSAALVHASSYHLTPYSSTTTLVVRSSIAARRQAWSCGLRRARMPRAASAALAGLSTVITGTLLGARNDDQTSSGNFS